MRRHVAILFMILAFSGLAYPSCQVISSEGTTTLSGDTTGADPLSGVDYISQACIVIASSNVTFDCNGSSITNNGTADAAGIVVNGSTSIDYTNVTIQNCPSVSGYEYGIYLYNTSQDTIRNSTVWNSTLYGIVLEYSNYNSVTNNTARETFFGFLSEVNFGNNFSDNYAYNDMRGLYLYSSTNNTFTNNTAYNNTQYGFFLYPGSDYNTFTNNTAYNNTQYGFYLRSNYNTFTNNTAYNNTQYGFYLRSTTGINITNCTLYNNQYGLYALGSNYTMQTTALLPESGAFTNYTNLSITDTMAASEQYSVNWSSFASSMPPARLSFAQKYVNITAQAGTPSIDEITFHWLTSELSGYSETYFELWKYNTSTGWTLLNNASDTTNNELKLYSLNPSSIYGILQSNESDCRVISYPGTYTLLNDISGANPLSGVALVSKVCVVIASPNVTFDCNGYSITNNGTLDAAGIVANGSISVNYTNMTIQNCPDISGYEVGIEMYIASHGTIRNTTIHNCSSAGMYMRSSNYTVITNNTVYDTAYGIWWAASGSSYNLVTDNIAHDNSLYGMVGSSNGYGSTLINNVAYNNPTGFIVYSDANNNSLISNTAYNNSEHGFYIVSSSNNSLLGDKAYDNLHGIHLYTASVESITNCEIYNNQYGLYANQSNYTMQTTSFLPSDGTYSQYATLSVTDNMSESEEYSINWTSFSGTTPTGLVSFSSKYVNITAHAGAPSIDEITFHWFVGELSGYADSSFELWKYNSSTGWTLLNETPDTESKTLTLYSLNPQNRSVYGIFGLTVDSGGSDPGESECTSDSDCAECHYCSTANGKCAILSTAECTGSGDCASGYNCMGCKCVQAGCIYDSDCPTGEYCAAPNCLMLECGCGYIENHNCIPYECCADSDCSAGYSCRDNSCVQTPAREPGSGEGGEGGGESGGDGGSGTGGGTGGNLTTGQEEPQVNATEPSQSQHEAEVPSASGMEEGAGAMGGSSEPLDVAGAGGIVLILLIVAGIVYFFYVRKG